MASASGMTKIQFDAQFDKESQRWFKYIERSSKPLIVKTIGQGVRAISAILERRTKIELSGGRIRVITGRLRNSIRYALFNNGQSANVTANVDYAVFVHEGTKFMSPRPFFEWAIQNSDSDISKITDQLGTKLSIGITRG